LSASIRWVSERSGAVPRAFFEEVWAAGGMAGDSTHEKPAVRAGRAFFP
jgi:hypothetical protein